MTYAVSSPEWEPESNGSEDVAAVASDASFPAACGETYPQATDHRDSVEGGAKTLPRPGSTGFTILLMPVDKTWDRSGRSVRTEFFLSLAGKPCYPWPLSAGPGLRIQVFSTPGCRSPNSTEHSGHHCAGSEKLQVLEQLCVDDRWHSVQPTLSHTVLPTWPGPNSI